MMPNGTDLYRTLFPQHQDAKWEKVDLNGLFVQLMKGKTDGDNPALDPQWCRKQMDRLTRRLGADYLWGGYLEDRTFLWRGHYHQKDQMCHLGVDYHVPQLTAVFLPKGGRLLMLEEDPDQNGGWGGRAIYRVGDLYVLFAHLTEMRGTVGGNYDSGHLVGLVAGESKNGGWAPHLHVQCLRNYDRGVDGYGSLTPTTKENFPDPEEVLQ